MFENFAFVIFSRFQFGVTISSIRPHLIRIPTQMDLYVILKKVSKNERRLSKKPLELVLYIGTALDYLLRFKDHCKPKASNSRRTVFNKDEHEVVLIRRFTEDDFDSRFESPEQSAIAYELLSSRLRKNCSFVSNWNPGVSSTGINASLFSKLNNDDVIALATQLIKVIQEHD
ncbi:hypothetical protein M3Y97_00071400 [Aphelenchoides bicaudatus]|nr:hypothetical protein M3Y97_00071400 [Aphelenchoides bicaudatus]